MAKNRYAKLALTAAAPLLLAMQAPAIPQSPTEVVAVTTAADIAGKFAGDDT